jgi:UV DNA damage endonuclease
MHVRTPVRKVGFAAVLSDGSLSTNHTTRLRLATLDRVLEIAHKNLDDLEAILQMLEPGPLRLFRLGSSLVPFASHEEAALNWLASLAPRLSEVGRRYEPLGFRFSMHPGQYITLSTPSEEVLRRSIAELEYSTDVLDAMGLDGDHKVVLHGGGLYGDRAATTDRLIRAVEALPERIRARLVLENDERFYNLEEILAIAERSGVPVVFDIHHHKINPSPAPLEELLPRVARTWKGVPKVHISSQRPDAKVGAHADDIFRDDLDALCSVLPFEADLMVEAKAKEVAAMQVWEWLAERRPAPPI